MNEVEIVNKAKDGDKEALIQLVMARQHEYYRLAYVYLQHKEDSLDVLQDMIVILYQNIQKLKNPEAFYSWSKTILVNCCRKTLKKRKRVLYLSEIEEQDYNEDFTASESRQDILTNLEKLNRNQQEAIKLRYFMGMDYGSIAEITSTPLGTVKSRISTGLTRLRESLGGDYS